jgi:uncharacterized protein YeaO (DUF488 family)
VLLGIKRIYDKASITDGKRILVDRLWPRGVRRSTSSIDIWLKDIAPSEELRKWFNHDPKRWQEFKIKYIKELQNNSALKNLRERIAVEDVTLIYTAKDNKRNNAVVLASLLKKSAPRKEEKKNISKTVSDDLERELRAAAY